MKHYKLLKDLPFAKAGEIFVKSSVEKDGKLEEVYELNDNFGYISANIVGVDEWFEEIEPNFWVINKHGRILEKYSGIFEKHNIDNLKSIDNYFETEEQAKKHLKWLKARVVLLEDTKGFKPDWSYGEQEKYFVCYDYGVKRLDIDDYYFCKYGEFCFKTEEDAQKSIEKHEKEWKIYLGVEG